MEGLIIKGIGGFYTLMGDDGALYTCRVRGRLRHESMAPVVGDRAEFDFNEGENPITHILPRKNLLTRPVVANLDKLFIVLAMSAPKPDLLLADKLLIQCEMKRITPVILLNKCDDCDNEFRLQVFSEYAATGYRTICVSALSHEGVEDIRGEIAG